MSLSPVLCRANSAVSSLAVSPSTVLCGRKSSALSLVVCVFCCGFPASALTLVAIHPPHSKNHPIFRSVDSSAPSILGLSPSPFAGHRRTLWLSPVHTYLKTALAPKPPVIHLALRFSNVYAIDVAASCSTIQEEH